MASNVTPKAPPGSLWKQPPKEKKAPAYIKQRGTKSLRYEQWRDTVAIPYLDATYGHICAHPGCKITTDLDVDHKQKRGSHAELKMSLQNLQYLCRPHHIQKDGGLRYGVDKAND